MNRASSALRRLILAVWAGGGACLMAIAAPAAFRGAPTRSVAADVVGAMLTRWHYVAIIAPLVLLLIEWYSRRLSRTLPVILFSAAAVLGAAQATVDIRIRDLRSSIGAVSSLAPSHPLRRQFGALHATSSALMLIHVVFGAAALVRDE